MSPRVLDERTGPELRRLIGRLLQEAEQADLALTRIRLAALDLTAEEVAGPRRCRVLIGRLDAATLLDTAASGEPVARLPGGPVDRIPGGPVDLAAARLAALQRLDDWIESGRVEVRSAGIGAWTPDFSVFARPASSTCLLGAHYFGHPQLTVGPSITVVTCSMSARVLLGERFEELWTRSHDVAPAITEVLHRAIQARGGERPGRGG